MMAGNHGGRWSFRSTSELQSSATNLSSLPVLGSSSSSHPFSSFSDHNPLLPQSWSQLLLSGLSGDEEDRFGVTSHFQPKKLENWEDQILNPYNPSCDVKQEAHHNNNLYGSRGVDEEFHSLRPTWSQQVLPVSSPRSCVTSLTTNILDFSYNKPDTKSQHLLEQSSESNSTATGGAAKKPRVQPSSSQPPLKVRKEKLGDRITALHQLVSPFGKTDTASVLLEAIGYIRFLQGQIEALSSPYLGTASSNTRNQHSVQGEGNCVFPEDPGQLLNNFCHKRKGGPMQDSQDKPKDLRSRGLCLVPVSCTQHVGSDNGADYWAPAIGGGF